jgi:PAS domain S-box-containing protein
MGRALVGPIPGVNVLDIPPSLLDELPLLVWRSDPDGKLNYLNRQWLEFTGRSLDEELGDGWIEGVHPEDAPAYVNAFRDAVSVRRPIEAEYRLRRSDGAYRWMLSAGRPVLNGDGQCFGYTGACIDLTERKLAEQAARRQEVLAEYARDTMLLVGSEGEILEANAAAERMYGYAREELLGLTIRDLRAPETHAGLTNELAQAREAGLLF